MSGGGPSDDACVVAMTLDPWQRQQWWLWARIPLALLPIAIFFVVYNQVVVDVNLRQLQLSLKVLSRADAVGKAEAAMTLIDHNLLTSMAGAERNPTETVALQYAAGVLQSDPRRAVEDAQTMVSTIAARKTEARGAVRGALDDANTAVEEMVDRIRLFPRQVFQQGRTTGRINVRRMVAAVEAERVGDLAKAEQLYRRLLEQFPTAQGRMGLKLRLAHLYSRQRSLLSAEQMYREVLAETTDVTESQIAQLLLAEIQRARQESGEVPALQRHVAQAVTAGERQRTLFDLGAAQMRLSDFDEAAQTFALAAEADPATPVAAQAQFRRAWCFKSLGRHAAAIPLLQQVTHMVGGAALTSLAQSQIADSYRAMGQLDASAESLEAAASSTKDPALAAMLTAQVGAVQLIDLHQTDAAEASFRRLQQAFPASAVSGAQQTMQQFQAQKTELRNAAQGGPGGPPVVGWLEMALPTFAETFATRVADAMQASGKTMWTRRLTDEDFQRQVLKRLRERFPGKLDRVQFRLRTEGLEGSMMVRAGTVWVPVSGQMVVTPVEGRLHVQTTHLAVGHVPVPTVLCQVLDGRINQAIDQLELSVQITQFEMHEGTVDVHVEFSALEKQVTGKAPRR